jgi:hypothetical protein
LQWEGGWEYIWEEEEEGGRRVKRGERGRRWVDGSKGLVWGIEDGREGWG